MGAGLGEDGAQVRAGKGRPPDDQMEQRASQAVNVRANVGRMRLLPLFGRQVIRGAEKRSLSRQGVGRGVAEGTRQPQVQKPNAAVPADDQIGWFDVAMHQAPFIGVLQTDRRLAHRFASIGDRKRAISLEQASEVQTFDVFHDQKVTAFRLSGVVRHDDVRVIEPTDGADFLFETGHRDFVDAVGFEELERDLFSQFHVASAINVAHTPFAEQFKNLVLPESRDRATLFL